MDVDEAVLRGARQRMVDQQLRTRDIADPAVLRAMERVPRHLFVPARMMHAAYDDRPLPIGFGQTISQPYIVALTIQLARAAPSVRSNDRARVFDIGTGSGYQAAVLAELGMLVWTVEIVVELAAAAQRRLVELGYTGIRGCCMDGAGGWPEWAPYDAVVAAAAPRSIPPQLLAQLAIGGRLVMPVGENSQMLTVFEKDASGLCHSWTASPVRFVPMVDRDGNVR